jgi:hypothetical protein
MPRRLRDPKLLQFWRRHLTRQPASGLTIRDYCRVHDLREPSFYAWRKIVREHNHQVGPARPAIHAAPSSPQPAFLPLTIVDSQPHRDAAPIDIRLPNGCRIRARTGCDRTLLADVLAILHHSPKPEARPC